MGLSHQSQTVYRIVQGQTIYRMLEGRISQLWSKDKYHVVEMRVEKVDEQLAKVMVWSVVDR